MDKKEKVEMVKHLIRQHGYQKSDAFHQLCGSMGLHYERHALDRFVDKLELLDNIERNKHGSVAPSQAQPIHHAQPTQPMQPMQNIEAQPAMYPGHPQPMQPMHPQQMAMPNQNMALAQHMASQAMYQNQMASMVPTDQMLEAAKLAVKALGNPAPDNKPGKMTATEVKKREAEITFELGALKIREAELLKELHELTGRGSDSDFIS